METGYESGIGAWYDKLAFEKACGSGSYPNNNAAYCKALIKHLQLLNVNKVVDLGCGNLQSYKGNIDWSTTGIQYVGYEANHIALKELEKNYPEMRFEQAILGDIPEPADAIIVKDVLIHWYDEAITSFFDQVFENFRYVIYMHSTTNRGYPNRTKREMYNKRDPSDRIGLQTRLRTGSTRRIFLLAKTKRLLRVQMCTRRITPIKQSDISGKYYG